MSTAILYLEVPVGMTQLYKKYLDFISQKISLKFSPSKPIGMLKLKATDRMIQSVPN